MKKTLKIIDKQKAVQIACKKANCNIEDLHIYSTPPQTNLYFSGPILPPDEKESAMDDCWHITVPWNDGKNKMMLRSSRIIIISKETGKVVYDGDAGDEG
jgi:hypothetical protein